MARARACRKLRWTLPLAALIGGAGIGLATPAGAAAQVTVAFEYNGTDGTDGSAQSWSVPSGVTEVIVVAHGAQGADGTTFHPNARAGLGGSARATIAVTPGEVLTVNVGGRGVTGNPGGNGGFNGGADGAAGGGGASDVRRSASPDPQRLVVAGGGGGFGGGSRFGQPIIGFAGGAGGGLVGTGGGGDSVVPGGGGGTQTSGGAGGASFFTSPGQAGSSGTGGFPGGGGGYFGGGGGATFGGESQQASGAGGGGSGFGPSGCASGCGPATVFETGVRSGDGLVTISYENSPPSAMAGVDRTVNKGTAFTLDASQSTDANGDPLHYHWQQVGGSPVAVIRDPDEGTPEAQVDGISVRADLTFRVTVTDVHGDSTTDDVLIRVK